MKKLLKFILMPFLVGTPTISVIACSPNSQISPEQVLNLAVGRMSSGLFKMCGEEGETNKLNLDKLPDNGTKYSDLDKPSTDIINDYFKSLVTTGSGDSAGNWEYPSVDVKISQKDDYDFITKYESKVQSKIILNATLTYQGKTASKDVSVIIFNDKTTSQEKASEICKDVQAKLNVAAEQQTAIELETLPPDKSQGNMPVAFQKIEASLWSAWVNPNPTTVPSSTEKNFLIDVIGNVKINVSYPASEKPKQKADAVFYELDTTAISTGAKFITGTISKLNIGFTYTSPYNSEIGKSSFNIDVLTAANQKIKVQQSTGSSMQNQLRNAIGGAKTIHINFNQISNPPGSMPTAEQNLNEYIAGTGASVGAALENLIFRGDVTAAQTGQFTAGIFNTYPSEKVSMLKEAKFEFLNSSKFTKQGEPNIGTFTVTFQLTYTLPNEKKDIIILTSNLVEIVINGNT